MTYQFLRRKRRNTSSQINNMKEISETEKEKLIQALNNIKIE